MGKILLTCIICCYVILAVNAQTTRRRRTISTVATRKTTPRRPITPRPPITQPTLPTRRPTSRTRPSLPTRTAPTLPDKCRENPLITEAKAVFNATEKPISLLPYLKEIVKIGCMKQFISRFERGSCSSEDFIDVTCNVTQYAVLKGYMECLNASNICMNLKGILMNQPSCIMDKDLANVAALLVHRNCMLPAEVFFLLPTSVMRVYLGKASKEAMMYILKDLGTHPLTDLFMELLGCEKMKMFMAAAQRLGVVTIQTVNADYIRFLPYLPEDTCRLVVSIGGPELMKRIENIKQQTFPGCRDYHQLYNKLKMMVHMDRKSLKELLNNNTVLMAILHGRNLQVTNFAKRIFVQLFNQYDQRQKCDDFKCGKLIAMKIKDLYKMSNQSVDATNIKAKLGNLEKCIDFQDVDIDSTKCGMIPKDFLRDAASASSRRFEVLANQCKPKDKQPTAYTEEDLIKSGCLVVAAIQKAGVYRKIPVIVLCDVFSTDLAVCLAENYVQIGFKRYLREKCQNESNIQTATLGEASFQHLSRLSNQEKEKIAEKSRSKGQLQKAKGLLLEVADNSSAFAVAENENLAKVLTSKDLKKKMKAGNIDAREMAKYAQTLVRSQIRSIAQNYFEQNDVTPGNITADQLREMQDLIKGLLPREILEASTRMPTESATIILKKRGGAPWKGKSAQAQTNVRLNDLQAKAGSAEVDKIMKELTPGDVERQNTAANRGLDEQHIRSATMDTASSICRKLASDDIRDCQISMPLRKRQAMACLGNQGNSSLMINDNNMDLLPLLNDISETQASEALDENFILKGGPGRMAPCPYCMPHGLASKVIMKLQSEVENNKLASVLENNVHGCWLLYLIKDSTSETDKQMIYKAITSKLDSIKEDMKCYTSEKVKCMLKTFTPVIINRIKKLKEQGDSVQADAAISVSPTVTRKKRQTQMYTCQMIQDMGSAVVSRLTTTDMINMDSGEFLNCISTFGQLSGWSQSQLQTLVQKSLANLEVTNVCDIMPMDLLNFGTIAYGFTTVQIACLPLTSDVITSFGQLYEWSKEQLTALASRYLVHNNLPTGAHLSNTDLVLMGSTLCGLSASDIAMIPTDAYGAAVKVIGEISSAEISCLQALVALAKHNNVYGPVTGWSASTYEDVNIVIAGLTGEELNTATESSITGWTTNGIKHIPVNELKKIDASLFDMLSREQSLEIPASKRFMLSAEQHQALNRADAAFYTNDAEIVTRHTASPGGTTPPQTTGVSGLVYSMSTTLMLILVTIVLL